MIDIDERMEVELYGEEQQTRSRPNAGREPMELELFDIFEEDAEDDAREEAQGRWQDAALEEQLRRAGFSIGSGGLACVQMVNALEAQMDVLEQVIFRKAPSAIFGYGVGFSLDDDHAFEGLRASAGPKAETLFQASPEESKTGSESAPKGSNGSGMAAEDAFAQIVAEEWAAVSLQDKRVYLALRKRIDEVRRAVTECLTSRQGDANVCLVCGDSFGNGRQLGGHMSRKHPGHSADYSKRRRLQNSRGLERDRRRYFKGMRRSPSSRQKPIAKATPHRLSASQQP